MSFLIGVLIGGVIVYFWLQSKVQEAQRIEQNLRQQLAQSDRETRDRGSQSEDVQRLEAQVATCQTDLQAKTRELQQVTTQLATAEARISTLQDQLTTAESGAAVATEPPVADAPTALFTPAQPEQPVADIPAATPTSDQPEQPVAADAPTALFTPAQSEQPVADVPETPPTPDQPDDLTKIEGIGPKVSQVLSESGIFTFAQLAATDASQLREILQAAGPRFKMMEPESWPEQAGLAAKGAWDDLQKLQDELDGGKYRR